MNNIMEYRGYTGSVEFSQADELFYRKVLGIRALVSYEGSNAHDLLNDFKNAIDNYLDLCESKGKKLARS